jgi:hypothetical protein
VGKGLGLPGRFGSLVRFVKSALLGRFVTLNLLDRFSL